MGRGVGDGGFEVSEEVVSRRGGSDPFPLESRGVGGRGGACVSAGPV